MRKYETYKCAKCGNEVEVQNVGGGVLSCCGEPMTCTTTSLTDVNLMKAFAGESMARNKYDLYADIAQEAGYFTIADHLREAALNERAHARMEFMAYKKRNGYDLSSVAANLLDAAAGENYEHTSMYPDFADIADAEGHKDIARMFRAIGKVEVEHEREYLELKRMLEEGEFFEDENDEVWVCRECGHIHRGKKAPKACAVCGKGQEYFKREFLG